MSNNNTAIKVVETMFESDWFSQWLGIERVEIKPGSAILKLTVRREMLNGFQILHGGIYYSLADSALAFASNSYGIKSVSIETSISHIKPCKEGDTIIAVTKEISMSNKIAIYNIDIFNQQNVLVSAFKGTVYRTGKNWFEE